MARLGLDPWHGSTDERVRKDLADSLNHGITIGSGLFPIVIAEIRSFDPAIRPFIRYHSPRSINSHALNL